MYSNIYSRTTPTPKLHAVKYVAMCLISLVEAAKHFLGKHADIHVYIGTLWNIAVHFMKTIPII
jgi:hypothetical protein